jgi:hypothetical protein
MYLVRITVDHVSLKVYTNEHQYRKRDQEFDQVLSHFFSFEEAWQKDEIIQISYDHIKYDVESTMKEGFAEINLSSPERCDLINKEGQINTPERKVE